MGTKSLVGETERSREPIEYAKVSQSPGKSLLNSKRKYLLIRDMGKYLYRIIHLRYLYQVVLLMRMDCAPSAPCQPLKFGVKNLKFGRM